MLGQHVELDPRLQLVRHIGAVVFDNCSFVNLKARRVHGGLKCAEESWLMIGGPADHNAVGPIQISLGLRQVGNSAIHNQLKIWVSQFDRLTFFRCQWWNVTILGWC